VKPTCSSQFCQRTTLPSTVKLGPSEVDDASIDSGVAPGDLVVVDGTEKLREGTKVELRGPSVGAPKGSDAAPKGDDTTPKGPPGSRKDKQT